MSFQIPDTLVPQLALAAQFSLGMVFLLSAFPKFRRPFDFVQGVVEFHILPAPLAYPFGLALILLESFFAFAFLTGWLADIAFPIAVLTLLAFLLAVSINLRRGRQIPCSCFGNASERISLRTVARLCLLLAVSLLLVWVRSSGQATVSGLRVLSTDVSMFSYLLLTAFVSVFLLLIVAWGLSLPELVRLAQFWRSSESHPGIKPE